jgi:hypothetical protein
VRNLFLALLVINVVFLLWTGWVDRPRDMVAAAPEIDVPMLELTAVPDTPPPPTTHCRSIGPFADALAATGTVDLLRARGLSSHQRGADGAVPDGYWVYVDDLKDLSARRKMIATLNAAGIRDAAVMPDVSDRVSIGIFSDQKHAIHRAEQVQELGFKPTLSVHQRPVSVLWLDVDLKNGDPDPTPIPPPVSPTAKKEAGSEALKVIDCPAKAAAG